ncbi:CPBP family glutamic-type intramembrane protease [Planococcus sp. MB-3u-03]|uniref:CPBP family glutamic-type intramembrane protease n=1 Tax=Planococcus sp. MB-3u-03 TaxID=2058136 RepID=UPI001E5E3C27|nr:CPBP family glutamic-type intramembrane protease [Planococcus sp. MB-3u-03]
MFGYKLDWSFLGTWPAICVSALLWAVWHVTIQSAGTIDVTIANSIANHGLMGLFLGLLWSKYRNFGLSSSFMA